MIWVWPWAIYILYIAMCTYMYIHTSIENQDWQKLCCSITIKMEMLCWNWIFSLHASPYIPTYILHPSSFYSKLLSIPLSVFCIFISSSATSLSTFCDFVSLFPAFALIALQSWHKNQTEKIWKKNHCNREGLARRLKRRSGMSCQRVRAPDFVLPKS